MKRIEPVYSFTKNTLVAFMKIFFRVRFSGAENIPRSGPAIIACNHISYLDPLCHGYMIVHAKRRVRFFAKSELWKNPILKFILTRARQIPVERGSGEMGPVEKAIEVLHEGDVVMIYPEATITTTDDLLPMRGKTGIARVALATGAPVIPCAVWGSHWVKPKGRTAVWKWKRVIMVQAGAPLHFKEYAGRENDPDALHEITDRVMAELDRMVRELRKLHPDGEAVPERKVRP